MLELRDVVRRAGPRWALEIEALSIGEGGIVAVAGRNGAGKSTLLRVMSLLLRPDRGRVLFEGRDAVADHAAARELRRQVVLVHQQPYLFDARVADNVAYGLRVRGVAAAERAAAVEDALERVGLAGFASRHARELSGGEAHRVAIARAMILRPKILLLDEPTAATDEAGSARLWDLLANRPWRKDAAVVVTTHTAERLPQTPDAHYRLESGRLAAGD